jgi:Domain of unknown function (DUF4282)
MVSPVFIMFFYYLGLVVIVLGALSALFTSGQVRYALMSSGMGAAGAIGYYIGVPLAALFFILIWRFYCELLIVLFSIFNRLGDISNLLKDGNASSSKKD